MGKVTVILSGDEARLLKALDRVVEKERKLARQAAATGKAHEKGARRTTKATGDYAQSAKQAGKANKDAFGAAAVARLSAYVGGLSAVTAAASAINDAFAKSVELQKRANAQAVTNSRTIGQLGQLADRPGEFRRLVGLARGVSEKAGVSQSEALPLVFALKSSGNLGDLGTFTQSIDLLGGAQEAAGSAKAVSGLIKSLGRRETGGARAILSKALAASGESPVTTVSGLLRGAAQSGGLARGLGVGANDLLSGISILAAPAGSQEQGATQLSALLKAATKGGKGGNLDFKGLGLAGIVARIQEKTGGDPKKVIGLLGGRVEAFNAFSTLSKNFGDIGRINDLQRNAQSGDELGSRLRRLNESPVFVNAVERRRVEQRIQNRKEIEGAIRQRAEGLIQEKRATGVIGELSGAATQFLLDNPLLSEVANRITSAGLRGRFSPEDAVRELGSKEDKVLLQQQLDQLRRIRQGVSGPTLGRAPDEDR